jgi:hypothetical protein
MKNKNKFLVLGGIGNGQMLASLYRYNITSLSNKKPNKIGIKDNVDCDQVFTMDI